MDQNLHKKNFKIGSVCVWRERERERERDSTSIQIKEIEAHLSIRHEFKYFGDTRNRSEVKK